MLRILPVSVCLHGCLNTTFMMFMRFYVSMTVCCCHEIWVTPVTTPVWTTPVNKAGEKENETYKETD